MRQAERARPATVRTCPPRIATLLSSLALLVLSAVFAPVPAATAAAVGLAFVPAEAPLPPDAGSVPSPLLSQSACAGPERCVAVGSYVDTAGTQQALIESSAAGAWSATRGSLPTDAGANPQAGLTGISCPAPGSCVAVGSYEDRWGDQRALVETLAAGSWTPAEVLLPPDAGPNPGGQLNAVWCGTPTTCVAVGSYDPNATTVDQVPLIETLSGGTWTPAEAGLPADGHAGYLTGVSCPAGGPCVAVGVYGVEVISDGLVNEDTLPLVSTLSSGTWTPSEGALPADADTTPTGAANVELQAVSCLAAGPCEAAGSYMTNDGSRVALAETLSDGRWSVGDLSLPTDAATESPLSALLSASCTTGLRCVAVGDYLDRGGDQRALVETLSGGSWRPGQVPLPANANSNTSAVLDGAAFSPPGSGLAVGSYQDAAGHPEGVLDMVPAPAPVAAGTPSPPPVAANAPAPPPVTAPSESSPPGASAIARGADGALWFTDRHGNAIGRMSTTGTVTRYNAPSIDEPSGIALGPDGALWFTNQSGGPGGTGSIGRVTPSGVVSNYTGPGISDPSGIALGPDGALWFTNQSGGPGGAGSIGRVAPSGVVSNYTGPGISDPSAITAGPDGALWFVNSGFVSSARSTGPSIGRLAVSGAVTTYATGSDPPTGGIAAGPDGTLWFTSSRSIGRITTAGVLTSYADPNIDGATGITLGPDGAMWFTERSGVTGGTGSIGRITTAGAVTSVTSPAVVAPSGIAAGPDGALWFTNGDDTIGRLSTAGGVTDYPSSGSGGTFPAP